MYMGEDRPGPSGVQTTTERGNANRVVRLCGRGARRLLNPTGWKHFLRTYRVEVAMTGVLIVLLLAMQIGAPQTLTVSNIENVLGAAVPLLLVATGQLLVLITGGIDLSVGANYALAGMAADLMMLHSGSIALGIIVGVAVGVAVGLVNGMLIVFLRLVPFIVTLATLSIAASLTYIISGGVSQGVPTGMAGLNAGHLIPGLPNYILIVVLTVIVASLFLRRTIVGRFLYAVGSNEEAARLGGIPTAQMKILAYTLSGLMASIAAIFALSELGAVEPAWSSALLLNSIAAVVIGGASLFGGVGTAWGALIGVLIISFLNTGLILLQVPSFWQGTTSGIIIIVAVIAEQLIRGEGGGILAALPGRLRDKFGMGRAKAKTVEPHAGVK